MPATSTQIRPERKGGCLIPFSSVVLRSCVYVRGSEVYRPFPVLDVKPMATLREAGAYITSLP